MPIKYKSTRGLQSNLSFEQVVLGGLANDKGLYIPESLPFYKPDEIEKVIPTKHLDSINFCLL
jgi:threonine synthase